MALLTVNPSSSYSWINRPTEPHFHPHSNAAVWLKACSVVSVICEQPPVYFTAAAAAAAEAVMVVVVVVV